MLNEKRSELIGAIIGDGGIRFAPKFHQYYVEMTGNKKYEREYFQYLADLFMQEFNLTSNIREDKRALRLRVYSKDLVLWLRSFNLPYNKEKCKNIFIPEEILKNTDFLTSCIRGITDTDGSLFFANKGYRKDYPTVEISTTSNVLAFQIRDALKDIFGNFTQGSFHKIYRISINGDKMLEKWMATIGFSNNRNFDKYRKYKSNEKWG